MADKLTWWGWWIVAVIVVMAATHFAAVNQANGRAVARDEVQYIEYTCENWNGRTVAQCRDDHYYADRVAEEKSADVWRTRWTHAQNGAFLVLIVSAALGWWRKIPGFR